MTDSNETTAERTIREALESVERIERESKRSRVSTIDCSDAEADEVQLIGIHDPFNDDDALDSAEGAVAAPSPKKSMTEVLLEVTIHAKAEMQEVLTQTQKEAKDLFDRLARVSADFENFKKRANREKGEAIRYGNDTLLKDMLPVHDNLQRALQAAPADSSLLEGIKLVGRQFEAVLEKSGVVGFSSVGEVFDPTRHEAVGARPDPEIPSQHVAEEYQRGYLLQDRLLRPAMVIVSAGPPATEN